MTEYEKLQALLELRNKGDSTIEKIGELPLEDISEHLDNVRQLIADTKEANKDLDVEGVAKRLESAEESLSCIDLETDGFERIKSGLYDVRVQFTQIGSNIINDIEDSNKATVTTLDYEQGLFEVRFGGGEAEQYQADINEEDDGFTAEVSPESSGQYISELHWAPTGLSPRSYKTYDDAMQASYETLCKYVNGLVI